MPMTVMQLLPALEVGGVERGTVEIAAALTAGGHRAIVVSAGGRLVEELRELGAQHIELPIGAKSFRSLGCIGPLREAIREHAVDIVHARSRLPAWIAHRALRGLAPSERPRWVTTVHGPYTVNAYSRIMTSGERVIAISEFIRDYILANYPAVDARRVQVIPRGIDRTRFSAAYRPTDAWCAEWHSHFPASEGRRLLVLPGRLTRWKGQTTFIDLMSALVARGAPVHGVIAGRAERRQAGFERELHALVAARSLGEHVSFLSEPDDLRDVLAHADIAYSLTSEPEAFGRTTIEALSLGTPVIGYEHGGTGEILRSVLPEGRIPYGDLDAAVAATERFLAHPVIVPPAHAYTLERMQQATIEVYADVIGRAGRS